MMEKRFARTSIEQKWRFSNVAVYKKGVMNMAIYWEDSLSTGIPTIDDQHKGLFDQFDKLSKAIEAGESNEEVEKLLRYLNEYADTHFSEEENLMSSYKYSGLEEQQRHHAQFKENITTLLKMLADNVPTREIAIRIDATLIRYFINHVRKLDSRLSDFIKQSVSS
jgi:hemerythrin